MSFDKEKIHELYPEAEDLMYGATLIWKLPSNKQDMLEEVCSNGQYFMEEKIDGVFSQFVRTENYCYMFNRTVSKTTGLLTEKGGNMPHITEALSCLPPKTIIIGELYFPGGTAKSVTPITGALAPLAIKRQEKNPIHYYLHDMIMYDGVNLMDEGALTRYELLKAVWEKYNLEQYSFLRLATAVFDNIQKEISGILNRGGEGGVLKKKDAPYIPDKRPAWNSIKLKQMDSADLVCTGLCDATREYTGKELDTWEYWETANGELYQGRKPDNATPVTKPYFLHWKTAIKIGAYNDNGELIDLGTVSSGLTDEDKQLMSENPENYIGKVVMLSCMSKDNKEHTLRHPVFNGWRDDKCAEECLISQIFS